MDSLLASYASSDDEAPPTPAPAPASAAARGGETGAKPAASSSFGGGSGGIFSSLPQPKSTPLFSSIPAPKSGPAFSTIPAPKSSTNPKRVVQYRPQPIRQPTGDSSDDEEDDAKKRRAAAADERPAVSAGSGPVSSFLPPPKHSLGLGGGGGAGTRRSAIDTIAPERPSLGAAVPSRSVTNTGAPEKAETGAAGDEDSEDSGSEEDMPVSDQQEDDEQLGSDAGAGHQQQQSGYDAGAGSTSGYESYAWDPNYYAQYSANYGWDSNGNANYSTGEQYTAYGGEQGGGYAHSHGVENVGGYGNVAAAPYVADYTGGYSHEAVGAITFPPVQDPVLPPMMGRIGGKRGRNDMPTEIVEVNQEELMKNRPKKDTSKLTGLAFGPSYQPAPSAKGKPSKLHKRKHQIGSLYFDMKSKEMELAERRSKGILTKAETQAKYGW